MIQFLAILIYVIIAAGVVFFSEKLSTYVDLLDKKTKISGAFLGGILLAAITSLPELFTSLTATVLIHDNHLVIGNILGSDIFNITLFAIIYIGFFKGMVDAKVDKIHIISIIICGLLYGCVAVGSFVFDANGWLLGWFNPISIFVIALYAFSVLKTPGEAESDNKETTNTQTVKEIVILFVIFAVLLVGASIGMTYVVDWINELFNLGSTFGGALFLGVATSLPETTATVTLCKKKNYNASYGNILGSNVFNFIILAIADILSFACKTENGYETIYKMDQSTFLLLVLGLLSMIIAIVSLILKNKNVLRDNNKFKVLYVIFGVLLVTNYVIFLVFSNIDLGFSFAPFVA